MKRKSKVEGNRKNLDLTWKERIMKPRLREIAIKERKRVKNVWMKREME